ncbi:hypothetical protein BKA61DRAFT_729257 [Leptodontidium sp. MPI-SDFR-AT-0119]|nr:hypothetical protein BKA61DRAFT_729257 [Leptodontidium sp. MPI-SDFR-AT-0119]
MQAALPFFSEDRSGRVINVSSISSMEGFVAQSIYSSTKAALEAMMWTWASKLAERFTFNAMNPKPSEDRYVESCADGVSWGFEALDIAYAVGSVERGCG